MHERGKGVGEGGNRDQEMGVGAARKRYLGAKIRKEEIGFN